MDTPAHSTSVEFLDAKQSLTLYMRLIATVPWRRAGEPLSTLAGYLTEMAEDKVMRERGEVLLCLGMTLMFVRVWGALCASIWRKTGAMNSSTA